MTASFFQRRTPEKRFVDLLGIGGSIATGACGFYSLAGAFVDHFLSESKTLDKTKLKNLMEWHLRYFPYLKEELSGSMTPSEQLSHLISTPKGLATFIREFSFTLRQLVVDLMAAEPENYRGVFVENNEKTSIEEMRKSDTWIDESAIAAAAQVLDLPIEVKVVDRAKEIPLVLHYHSDKRASPLVMQLQNQHYIPELHQPERFEEAKKQSFAGKAPVAPMTVPHHDLELDEILSRIKEDDKRLLRNFEEHKHRIEAMLDGDDLSVKDLLDIYIKGMQKSDYLEGRIKYVGIEHGNQRFFEDAIEAAREGRAIPAPASQPKSYEALLQVELVHALARAMSIGQLDQTEVYEPESFHP